MSNTQPTEELAIFGRSAKVFHNLAHSMPFIYFNQLNEKRGTLSQAFTLLNIYCSLCHMELFPLLVRETLEQQVKQTYFTWCAADLKPDRNSAVLNPALYFHTLPFLRNYRLQWKPCLNAMLMTKSMLLLAQRRNLVWGGGMTQNVHTIATGLSQPKCERLFKCAELQLPLSLTVGHAGCSQWEL